MIDLSEIEIETLESMTIYLADDFRDDREELTNFSNPFHWMNTKFTIIGVRSQVANLNAMYKKKSNILRQELIGLMRRTCQWKNGKSQDKRIKEALEIFTYLDLEAEFEAELV